MELNNLKKEYKAREYSNYFNTILELSRQPVGVRFLFDKKEFEKSKLNEIDGTIPYCTSVRDAMKGKGRKLRAKNFACVASAYALGMEKKQEDYTSGRRYVRMKTYKNIGVSRNLVKNVKHCEYGTYAVEVAPLDYYEENDPDVVIIVTNPFNAMRISHGYSYHHGYIEGIRFSGMCAVCHELTSYPYETRDLNMSMMCSGTRKLSQWNEDELGIAFPYEMTDSILDGMIQTINPLERDKKKKIIAEKAKENNLSDNIEIEYSKNYDDGAMRTKHKIQELIELGSL